MGESDPMDRPAPADTARADQIDAAERSALRAMAMAMAEDDLAPDRREGALIDAFWEDFERRLLARKVKSCRHLRQPGTAFVSFMFPDQMNCGMCFIRFIEPQRTAATDKCDLCLQPSTTFIETLVQKAFIVVMGDLCERCAPPKESR